jgi:hypothetical protein
VHSASVIPTSINGSLRHCTFSTSLFKDTVALQRLLYFLVIVRGCTSKLRNLEKSLAPINADDLTGNIVSAFACQEKDRGSHFCGVLIVCIGIFSRVFLSTGRIRVYSICLAHQSFAAGRRFSA